MRFAAVTAGAAVVTVVAGCVLGAPIPSSWLPSGAVPLPDGMTATWSSAFVVPWRWSFRLHGLVVTGHAGVVLRAASVTLPIEAAGHWTRDAARPVRFLSFRAVHAYALAGWSGTAARVDAVGVVLPASGGAAATLLTGDGAVVGALDVRDLVVDGPSTTMTLAVLHGVGYRDGGFVELAATDLALRGRPPAVATAPSAMVASLAVGGGPPRGGPDPVSADLDVSAGATWRPSWVRFENVSGSAGAGRLSVASGRWLLSGPRSASSSRGSFAGAHLWSADPAALPPVLARGWPDGVRFSAIVESASSDDPALLDLRRLDVDVVGAGLLHFAASVAIDPGVPRSRPLPVVPTLLSRVRGLTLASATVSFTDDGLVGRVVAALVAAGAAPDAAAAKAMVAAFLAPLAAIAPAQPGAAEAIASFVRVPGVLSVLVRPPDPLHVLALPVRGPSALGATVMYAPRP